MGAMVDKEPERGMLLNWYHRLKIGIGMASEVSYCHQQCEQIVIHSLSKSQNILVDMNFNPILVAWQCQCERIMVHLVDWVWDFGFCTVKGR